MGVELGLVAMTTSLQFAVFLMLGCYPLTWIHNPKILNLSLVIRSDPGMAWKP